jgi:hypothetical protein
MEYWIVITSDRKEIVASSTNEAFLIVNALSGWSWVWYSSAKNGTTIAKNVS